MPRVVIELPESLGRIVGAAVHAAGFTLDGAGAAPDLAILAGDRPDALARVEHLRRTHAIPILFLFPDTLEEATKASLLALEAVDAIPVPLDGALLGARLRMLARLLDARVAERARLNAVLENLPAGIAVVEGSKHVYTLSNALNREMLGGRDVVGRTVLEAFPEAQALGLIALMEQVRRTGVGIQANEFPMTLPQGDGGSREVFLNGAYEPLRYADGTIEGVVGFAYEITDQVLSRKRAEASEATLRRAEEQLRVVTDSVPARIALIGRDERYRLVNRPYAEWFGTTESAIVGTTVRELLGDAAYVAVESHVRRALAGETATFETRLEYPDRVRDVQVTYVPHRGVDARGEPEIDGFVALILDVTSERSVDRERLELLARERDARASAEAAVAQRDEFLSVASHELKTPLTSLSLQLQILARTAERLAAPELQAPMAKLRTQVSRLSSLVEELLDVTRIASGRLPLVPVKLDLVQLVREVATRFEDHPDGSTIARHGAAHLVGAWDRSRLDQVITNLLSNAVKYGRGAPIDVTVTEVPLGARITVRDRGIGIAPEDHARIFERFERAASARQFGGLGLGLWIVRSIVEAHRGTLRVESTLGAGSTFIVELPLE